SPLSSLDLATSRLWPAKQMIFVRFTVTKANRLETFDPPPTVACDCGGYISSEGVCQACGRDYADGRIIDLVTERSRRDVDP
ncbi:MAG TPA: hypothetical protein VLY65_00040, partial [Nitrososphaerales archaeon]|nr:hypothetical protein [Nitrososphaerales archaeon]